MLDTIVDMRVEAATLAAESKQLRTEAKKQLRKARRLKNGQRHGEAPLAYHKHRNIYLERMNCRREARLHHLARMMLKGTEYHRVEAFTYENVNVDALYDRAWQWDSTITYEYVLQWLNYDSREAA